MESLPSALKTDSPKIVRFEKQDEFSIKKKIELTTWDPALRRKILLDADRISVINLSQFPSKLSKHLRNNEIETEKTPSILRLVM